MKEWADWYFDLVIPVLPKSFQQVTVLVSSACRLRSAPTCTIPDGSPVKHATVILLPWSISKANEYERIRTISTWTDRTSPFVKHLDDSRITYVGFDVSGGSGHMTTIFGGIESFRSAITTACNQEQDIIDLSKLALALPRRSDADRIYIAPLSTWLNGEDAQTIFNRMEREFLGRAQTLLDLEVREEVLRNLLE